MKRSKTFTMRAEDVKPSWHIVDAAGKTLGRLASQVAHVLRGKHRPEYSPHLDLGDRVIVVNAEQVRLSGNKLEDKVYYRHSGYPGGLKSRTAGDLLRERPERLIELAVWGMLPHNRLGRRLIRKLKVYRGEEHPHGAQNPQPLEVEA